MQLKVRRLAWGSNQLWPKFGSRFGSRTWSFERHRNWKPCDTSCDWFAVRRLLLELLARVIEESSYKHVFADMPAFWFSLNYVNTLHNAIWYLTSQIQIVISYWMSIFQHLDTSTFPQKRIDTLTQKFDAFRVSKWCWLMTPARRNFNKPAIWNVLSSPFCAFRRVI